MINRTSNDLRESRFPQFRLRVIIPALLLTVAYSLIPMVKDSGTPLGLMLIGPPHLDHEYGSVPILGQVGVACLTLAAVVRKQLTMESLTFVGMFCQYCSLQITANIIGPYWTGLFTAYVFPWWCIATWRLWMGAFDLRRSWLHAKQISAK